MKNKRVINFILILTIFIGSSVSALGIMALNTGAVTSASEAPRAVNPAVSIISLDDDVTLTKSVEQLDSVLSPYIDVDITTITDLEYLDNYFTENSEDYIILYGHSNKVGMEIDDQLISWSDMSNVVTQNKEQIVIIPTCESYNLYRANAQAMENVISPFDHIVDYRVSVDLTTLAMGLLLENEELGLNAIDSFSNNIQYVIKPEETLPVTESGSFTTSGVGRIEVTDVMVEFLLANSFILGASVSTAISQAFLRALGYGGIPLSFIIQIMCVQTNFAHTAWFFLTHLGLFAADYVVDRYTYTTWQSTFDEFGWCRWVWYSRMTTKTYYTFYSAYYYVNGVKKQDYYNVRLTIDMHVLDTLFIYGSISLGLLSTNLVSWYCSSSGTRIISGGGGGGDLPI